MQLQQKMWLLLVCGATLVCNIEARKIRIRPVAEDPNQDEDTIQYYAASEPQEEQDQRIVYVAAADQYNGYYGQPTASPRSSPTNYLHPSTSPHSKAARLKEAVKTPPVQTIRNYNKVNDDGSFTFGYEAADGSFKEETRGTDCVVRGKYGYVDPDGNKREFTYVSGNPCDPNAPKEEDELPEPDSKEPESGPANYPNKPIRPLRPVTPPPKPNVVTVFQNDYQQDEDVQPEPEQLLKPHSVQAIPVRPQYITRPQLAQEEQVSERDTPQSFQRTRLVSSTPSSIYKQSASPLNITPRPVSSSTSRLDLPATTYRPQLQIAVTPRPSLFYTKELSASPRPAFLSSTPSPVPISVTPGNIDFDAEFQRFQHDNNVVTVSPSPSSVSRTTPKLLSSTEASSAGGQVYSSELVFDPVSGLYNTQLYQALPQTDGDFSLSQRIQPYVHQPQAHLLNFQQLQQQSPLYRTLRPSPTQAFYQQQQAELQFQNSAQLFAHQQQQRARAQQSQPQKQRTAPQPQAQQQPQQLLQPAQPQQLAQPQQQYYFLQPSGLATGGQIEDFLRGHNIQY